MATLTRKSTTTIELLGIQGRQLEEILMKTRQQRPLFLNQKIEEEYVPGVQRPARTPPKPQDQQKPPTVKPKHISRAKSAQRSSNKKSTKQCWYKNRCRRRNCMFLHPGEPVPEGATAPTRRTHKPSRKPQVTYVEKMEKKLVKMI